MTTLANARWTRDDVRCSAFSGFPYLGTRRRIPLSGLSDFLATGFARLHEALEEEAVAGEPTAIYCDGPDSEGMVDVTAALPATTLADARTATDGRPDLIADVLVGCTAATTMHYGDYGTLARSYDRLEVWVRAHQLHPTGTSWEEYLIGPADNADSLTWCTRISLALEPGPAVSAPGDGRGQGGRAGR